MADANNKVQVNKRRPCSGKENNFHSVVVFDDHDVTDDWFLHREVANNMLSTLDSGEETFAFRVWQSDVAPPKSLKSVALVLVDSVQRGQNNNRGIFGRLGNGIRNLTPKHKALLLAAIAAAILIPIAADDDDAS